MPDSLSVVFARHGRKGRWAAAFLILATACLAAIPALASTVRRMGLKEIVGASDTIVQGRVESTRSFWRGKQIYTEVNVGVSRALKGPRADRLTFLQAGGRVDSPVPLEMTVPGAPILSVGDEAYFFLQPGKPGERYVVGLFQGHVALRHDARGDFVVFGGARKSPVQFEEEIRRQIAGQRQDVPGGVQ
jgi:hypothetical protein